MAVRIPWNEHEIAILIDACITFDTTPCSKTEIIKSLSIKLRTLAINNNIEIDDVYRNENGISMQFTIMQALLHDEKSGLHNASKLFIDMKDLYQNNKNEYNKLLKEAIDMLETKHSNQDDFVEWLSSKVSPAQLSEMCYIYKIIEEYCKRLRILNMPLLECTNIKTLKSVRNTIESNKGFRIAHKGKMREYVHAVTYLIAFWKECNKEDSMPSKTNKCEESYFVEEEKQAAPFVFSPIHNLNNVQRSNQSIPIKNMDDIDDISQKLLENKKYRENMLFVILTNTGLTLEAILSLKVSDFYNTDNKFKGYLTIDKTNMSPNAIDVSGKYLISSKIEFAIKKYLSSKKSFKLSDYLFVGESNRNNNDEHLTIKSANRDFMTIKNICHLSYDVSARILRATYLYHYGTNKAEDSDENNKCQPIKNESEIIQISSRLVLEKRFRDNLLFMMGISLGLTPKEIRNIKYDDILEEDGSIRTQFPVLPASFCKANEHNYYIESTTILAEAINLYVNYVKIFNRNDYVFKSESNNVSGDSLSIRSIYRIIKSVINDMGMSNIEVSALTLKKTFIYHQLLMNKNDEEAKINICEALGHRNLFQTYEYISSTSREFEDETFKDKIGKTNLQKTPITKLLCENQKETKNQELDDKQISVNLTMYEKVLRENFPRGFRIGSTIEIKKFKRYWESLDTQTEVSDAQIEKNLGHCGITYEGRIYHQSNMLSVDTKTKLFEYINNAFSAGITAMYYESLFDEFSDDFLERCMYNAEMLREYLKFVNDGQFFVGDKFVSRDANTIINPDEEIKSCFVEAAVPLTYENAYEKLSHLSQQKIKQTLNFNNDFISNGRSEYFHINITVFSDEDLLDISTIIANSIAEKKFISGNELVDAIKNKYPYIIDNNSTLSELGIRNAIAYKLKNHYSFEGNIISDIDEHISMADVFADFCKKRESFTLDELKILKEELNTNIYFESVYENSLRISQTNFVSKGQAMFDIVATDLAIDRFCVDDYIPVKQINQFGSFPDAGFQWNSFLLEHYVASYSSKYRLVHGTFNESVCVGGIVKKASRIETFEDLIIDVLSKSKIELNKITSLQLLCDEGYIARRYYSGIEEILIKAIEQRNQKGI